jgi:penicillin-binding protein 1B
VFARPLELYPNKPLQKKILLDELARLGYQTVSQLSGPGQFIDHRVSMTIATRGFRFSDGQEPARTLQLQFTGDRVATLSEPRANRVLPLARLEPLQIDKIYPTHNEDRILITLDETPPLLIKALIAVEDRRFFKHVGVDPVAIGRALMANLRAGDIRQGGSTLTQQLVKNFYLGRERSVWRKVSEAVMAIMLEWRFSKDEIIEAYINEVFLGQDGSRAIHGFGTAAQFYFGVPLRELKTHQLALLAGLARGASYYNPRRHPERALARRNLVLGLMAGQGMMTQAHYREAMKAPLGVAPKTRISGKPFYAFMDLVRRQLRRDYRDEDLRSEGLQIFTTLEPRIQSQSEQILSKQIAALEKSGAGLQGAIVVTGTENGEVLALVGDRKAEAFGFNRALDAKRQIGSLIKPVVYLAALIHPEKFHVMTRLSDTPLQLKDQKGQVWSPQNYTKRFHGPVPLHEALAQSFNLATIKLGMEIGIPEVKKWLAYLGVEENVPEYPSMLLGTLELTPLQVAQMYQTFSSGGFHTPLRAIREVLTKNGKPVKRYGLAVRQVVKPAPAFLMNYLLTEVVAKGTARQLAAELPDSMPLAGKTGTTDGLRDSWFAGYGGDLLAVAWVGRDDNRSAGLTGATGAMRVWSALMRELKPAPLTLTAPRDIDWHWMDETTGFETEPECAGASPYPFMNRSVLSEYQPCYRTW